MNTSSTVAAKLKRNKRWRKWRWILALASAAFLALTGWLRLSEALRNFNYLREIRLFPDPAYLVATGALRGLLFTITFALLLLHARIAPCFTRGSCITYLAWIWVDRVFFGTREAFLFFLASTLMISALTLFFAFALVQRRDYP